MRFLNCPKCGIKRFYLKNQKGDIFLIYVTTNYEIVSVKPELSKDGFDTSIIYCIACSWSGSIEELKRTN